MPDAIPSLELRNKEERVTFAIRTMEALHDKFGGVPDVPHRHNYYTVVWVRQGAGTHRIDFTDYPLEPEVVFFIRPGQVHQMLPDSRPQGWAILFTAEFLQNNHIREAMLNRINLFRDISDQRPLAVPAAHREQMQALTSAMRSTVEDPPSFQYEALGAYLKLFLIECNRICDQDPLQRSYAQEGSLHVLETFKRLVDAHYSQWHKVSEYADKLHITANHLNEVVKMGLGCSAKTYIQDR
ncbi:MAG: AraC family ligand binding domain-containing protein, partial [Bacteroidota bacterium]